MSDCHETKSKRIGWPQGLKCDHQVWPWPWLRPNFQGQISNLLYLSKRRSNCHEAKSKYIDCTLGLKCDHQIWPWPSPWPWIFKGKYGICYISTKSGPIATKRKTNISIELWASNVTNGFDLDHDLDLWIFKVRFDLWPCTRPWPWIVVSQNGREGGLTLNKGGGSGSFMTMTIWWPRSGKSKSKSKKILFIVSTL